jgi:hypothetical protein
MHTRRCEQGLQSPLFRSPDRRPGPFPPLTVVKDTTSRTDELFVAETKRLLGARDTTKPFYMQLAFQNVHKPLPELKLDEYDDDHKDYLASFGDSLRGRFAGASLKLDECEWSMGVIARLRS